MNNQINANNPDFCVNPIAMFNLFLKEGLDDSIMRKITHMKVSQTDDEVVEVMAMSGNGEIDSSPSFTKQDIDKIKWILSKYFIIKYVAIDRGYIIRCSLKKRQ